MKRLNRYLIIVAIIQVALLALVFTMQGKNNSLEPESFLTVDLSSIDEITIESDGKQVQLNKKGDQWMQENYQSFIAPQKKIADLFDAINNIKVSYPIANSKEASDRFEVGDNTAQKTITFGNGGKAVETLYIGSGSGLRKVHARSSESNNIFTIEFPSNSASALQDDWIDKTQLQVEGEILGVKAPNFEINNSENVWTIKTDIPDDKEADQTAIDNWVEKFKTLEIAKWIEPTAAEKITLQNPVATFNLRATPNTIDFAFYKSDDKYYVKRFGRADVFSIYNYRAEEIIETSPDDFVKDKEDVEPNTDSGDENTELTNEIPAGAIN